MTEKQRQKMCGCAPGHPCPLHNEYSKQPEEPAGKRYLPCTHVFRSEACGVKLFDTGASCDHSFEQCRAYGNERNFAGTPIAQAMPGQVVCTVPAPKPISTRVICRLCTCEGVHGTVLCKEHLEGFEYACQLLMPAAARVARDLTAAIQQPKKDEG